MSEMILNYAKNLIDTPDEKQEMIEYATVVLRDSVQERKYNNLIRRKKSLRYKERNRRK